MIFITGNAAPAPNEYLIRGAYDKFKRAYDMRGPHITFRDHRDPEHGQYWVLASLAKFRVYQSELRANYYKQWREHPCHSGVDGIIASNSSKRKQK